MFNLLNTEKRKDESNEKNYSENNVSGYGINACF